VTQETHVQVAVVHGEVPESERRYAVDKIEALLHLAPAPVLFARVTLAHEDAPSIERPVVAKGVLDVNGRPVRAHVAAATDREAVDLLEAKLRRGMEALTERRQARRHEPAEAAPGSWRHGMLPTPRPAWFPRPVEERELVRRKSHVLHERTVAEAALDLVLLDQVWVLFSELTTGSDALLADTGDGFALTIASGGVPDVEDVGAPVELELGAPHLGLEAALTLLDELGAPFLFFVDEETGRGRVVYRRYDGHHGSVTGAGPASAPRIDPLESPVP
jgi:ribosome-associated translation inhibitor RaiA